MEFRLFLPHKYKLIGWIILIPSFIMGALLMAGIKFEINAPVFSIWGMKNENFTIIYEDIYNEIIGIPLLISLMMVAFSREKIEDEYIMKIRLESLLWAIFLNFIIIFFTILFVYNDAFYDIMTYNLFTVLIFFIVRFNFVLFIINKQLDNEK